METYDSIDCSGEVKIIRALMYNNRNWTFQTVWDTHGRTMDCNYKENEDLIKKDATCSWSNCLCDSSDCKQYFKVGQCIQDGTISNKLVYKRVNYDERDYCTFSEGYLLKSDDVPLGLTIYKKKFCYLDTYFNCDLYNFSMVNCSSHQNIASFSSGTITKLKEECGYFELMFGSNSWWDFMHRGHPLFLDFQSNNFTNSSSTKLNQYSIIQFMIALIIITIIL